MSADGQVRVQGVPVHYRSAGGGPVVMLVHGLGLSSRVWDEALRAASRSGFRAVAPDLPGFGGTPMTRSMDVPETTDWLLEFATALGIGRAAWVGHSVSCQAVIELAARAPHRSWGLVLASPTGTPVRFRLPRQLGRILLDAPREGRKVLRIVLSEYVRNSKRATLGTWFKAARHDPLGAAPAVRSPAILFVGEEDPVVKPEFVELLAQRLSGARIVRLHGGAHGVIFVRTDEFLRRTMEFLRSCSVPGGDPLSPIGTPGDKA